MDDVARVRPREAVYLRLSHASDTLTHSHFQTSKRRRDKSMVSWQRGQSQEGVRELRQTVKSCCCCKTGQTGLRRAERHSEGTLLGHIQSIRLDGAKGIEVGGGNDLTTATFPWLGSWQGDMNQASWAFFFLLVLLQSHHKFINSTVVFIMNKLHTGCNI